MTAPTSPTGGCHDPAGRGATTRVVIDQTPIVSVGWRCLKPIAGTRQWCHLAPKHKGLCLALPNAHVDITPDNPNVRDQKS